MQLLAQLLGKRRIEKPKTIADYQREDLVKQGREQFLKLVEKGLRLPVALSQ